MPQAPHTTHGQFAETAAKFDGELALIDGEHRFTYGQLAEEVAISARRLKQTLGFVEGDVVAASLRNGWQSIVSFLAVTKLGGIFVPVNPQWRAEEVSRLSRTLKVRGVITSGEFREPWAGSVERIVNVDAWGEPGSGGPGAMPVGAHHDIAAYLTTSGSTGEPRFAPRSHRNLIAGARNVASSLRIGPGHRFLSVIPFHHSNGFHNCLVMPLLSGACVVAMRNFTPQQCAQLIQREGVNVLIGSPFIYGRLLDQALDPGVLSSLKICISAGARMPAALAQRWRDRFRVRVRQLYGSTETSVISIDRGEDEFRAAGGTFVGSPIPGVEVQCRASSGEPVAAGDVGELAVRSPAVMSGYFGDENRDASFFRDGFYRTGDLGYIDSQANLYLTGRIRRVINLAGVKVDPAELELVLEALPEVDACFVDAASDGRESEVIRARIVLRPGAHITRGQVVEECRSRLAEYKLPRVIEFLDVLPASLSGKITAASKHQTEACLPKEF